MQERRSLIAAHKNRFSKPGNRFWKKRFLLALLCFFTLVFFSFPLLSGCGKPKPKTNSELERLKPKKKKDDREMDPDLSAREYFDEDAQGKPVEKKRPSEDRDSELRGYSKKGLGCKKGNCKNGEGIYVYETRDVYLGNFSNEKRQGRGILVYSDGDKYEGNWSTDEKSGFGTYFFRDGSVFRGEFSGGGAGRGKFSKNGKSYQCRLESRKILCK
ncbi:hypothetical protein EHO61_14965 [Leptospira fluminis]|uniref:Membrane-binding protein n=1 Tax=Leptospira fluminis TaxID=2484979 RepID=A0A4R9GLI2_9LEPT|nr:hypothetical protein [Leptospira fluminis]TGK15650.1 hypothetical protein EHO61_14965 [Leptospira fluminis]